MRPTRIVLLLLVLLAACGGGAEDRPAAPADLARADPAVAAALREGDVARVVQRPAPGGGTAVGFLFAAPVTPAQDPFEVLCDVAGQTPRWQGVAARVQDGVVQDASPVWEGGANCAGLVLGG